MLVYIGVLAQGVWQSIVSALPAGITLAFTLVRVTGSSSGYHLAIREVEEL